jgi:hypothetical protein
MLTGLRLTGSPLILTTPSRGEETDGPEGHPYHALRRSAATPFVFIRDIRGYLSVVNHLFT